MEFKTEKFDLVDESSVYENNLKEFRSGQMRMKNGVITLYNDDKEATITIDAQTQIIKVGGSNVQIDGENKRIIINDGTNDRVLMGFLENKF